MPYRHFNRKGEREFPVKKYAYPVVAWDIRPRHTASMENMARIREDRGLTQKKLAEMVGANQATISKIEKGVGNPTLGMIRRIAVSLECSEIDLFAADELQHRLLAAFASADQERQQAVVTIIESMAQTKR